MAEIVDPVASDRRRDWGLILLAGGGMAMTAFASVVLWMLYIKNGPLGFLFYMGMAALGLVAIVLTGFSGLLVKRTLRVGRDGFASEDKTDA